MRVRGTKLLYRQRRHYTFGALLNSYIASAYKLTRLLNPTAKVLGPERTRNELIPYISGIVCLRLLRSNSYNILETVFTKVSRALCDT